MTDEFLAELEAELLWPLAGEGLGQLAERLKEQLCEGLQTSLLGMLPSHIHTLPTGRERGRYLAADLGGSTLRIAVVELTGRGACEAAHGGVPGAGAGIHLSHMTTCRIEEDVRALVGSAFFGWLADRLSDALTKSGSYGRYVGPMPLALTWSFPIKQTSLQTSLILPMGKGFHASDGMVGRDLGEVIRAACSARGLAVSLNAIVNDSEATLLAAAYADPAASMALILGTGFNASCFLPVAAIGPAKLRGRRADWLAAAGRVIVNVELSLFGAGVLPLSRWDRALRAAHPRPDFQPFEYVVGGGYLGELCRLALVDAAAAALVFDGQLPPSLAVPYSLSVETVSDFESDTTPDLSSARVAFITRHPPIGPVTTSDLRVVRRLASLVTRRSGALVAAGLHALWALRGETERDGVAAVGRSVVACTGSVVEKYPAYRARCQGHVDALVGSAGAIELVAARESSLLGAAVAAACVQAAAA